MIDEVRDITEMDTSVHVSVLVVSYNTRELTLGTIQSAFDSIVDPRFVIEVIVVDNGSTDASASSVRERFPQCTVRELGLNVGFAQGSNIAAQLAVGNVLLHLNSDTVVRKGAIETLYAKLEAEPGLGIVGPYLENVDGSYQGSMMSFPNVWRTFCFCFWLDKLFPHTAFFADAYMLHVDPDIERNVDVIVGTSLMIRRKLFERLDGFDATFLFYCEECDLCQRAHDAGFGARYVPAAHVMHYGGASSSAKPWWTYRLLRRAWTKYARKHGGVLSFICTTLCVHAAYAMRIPLYSIAGIFDKKRRALASAMLGSYLHVDEPFAAPPTVVSQ